MAQRGEGMTENFAGVCVWACCDGCKHHCHQYAVQQFGIPEGRPAECNACERVALDQALENLITDWHDDKGPAAPERNR